MLEISVEVVIRTDYETIRIVESAPALEGDVPLILDSTGEVAIRKAKAAVSA